MSQQNATATESEAKTAEPERASTESAHESASSKPSPEPELKQQAEEKQKIPRRVFFFGTCAVVAILAYCIVNAGTISGVFSTLGDILAPLTIGGIIAYLCNPIMRFYEYIVFGKMKKGMLHHSLSLFLTVVTVFAAIAGIIALIVPELIKSIEHLIDHAPEYFLSLLTYVNGLIQKITARLPIEVGDISTPEKLMDVLTNTFGSMENLLEKALSFLSGFMQDSNAIGNVWNFLVGIVTVLKNVFIGMFIAFYLLSSKEKRSAQVRKFRHACLSEKQNKKLMEFVKVVNQTFGGYVKGIILDAIVVAIVMFIILTIFNISEYNLLIAAICGITNIIPVFGPFIGAIPSGLIVLISNPSKLLPFIIIVLVVQQIEGNIIMPRIQGNSTNISSLAVLIAITVMGSLFGIMGMIIGVPIFAIIIEMVKRYLESRLQKKGKPTDTIHYYPKDAIGDAEEEVYYEHRHLLYWYDHSKLKKHIEHLRANRNKRRVKKGKEEIVWKDRAQKEAEKAEKKNQKAAEKARKTEKKAASKKEPKQQDPDDKE